jgi:hypothetical protein
MDKPVAEKAEALKKLFLRLSTEERREALYLLLRDWLGDDPTEEVYVDDPRGVTYAYIVPARLRFELVARSADEWDKIEESLAAEDPGPLLPMADVLDVLEMYQDPAVVAERLNSLGASSR